MSYNKKIYIGLAIIAVLGGALIWSSWFKDQIIANGFQGQLREVEDNSFFLEGAYLVDDKPIDVANRKGVWILIAPETKFNKIVWYMPTDEELAKTGGRWNPSDLKKEQREGGMGDLLKAAGSGLTITATSNKNIYNKSSFRADSIEYIKQIYSGRPESAQ